MKKLLLLLLLCSCISEPKIPEGKEMICTNFGTGIYRCENDEIVCIKQMQFVKTQGFVNRVLSCEKKINKK